MATDRLTDERVREIAAWTPHPAMNALSPVLPDYIERSALAREVLEHRARLTATEARLAEAEGAMRADDERLTAAALKVWGENIHGCDAPDWMAEEILGLRIERDAAVAIAREAVGDLDAAVRWVTPSYKGEWLNRIDDLRARLAQIGGKDG